MAWISDAVLSSHLFQLESHRYQTMQAADWIAGLIGRLGAYWKAASDYPEKRNICDLFRGASAPMRGPKWHQRLTFGAPPAR